MRDLLAKNGPVAVAGMGSLALLLGAWAFQYLGGLAPCHLCIWQRWPHGLAVVLACLVLGMPRGRVGDRVGGRVRGRVGRFLIYVGVLLMLISAGLGLYHAGVEWQWWPGPASCTGVAPSGLSADELLDQIMAAPLVRCDAIAWQLLGLSMAGWNAVFSLMLAVLWMRGTAKRA